VAVIKGLKRGSITPSYPGYQNLVAELPGRHFIVRMQNLFSFDLSQPSPNFEEGKSGGKTRLRLSFDNRSVANAIIHFPVQKLLTFYSIFTANLLVPKHLRQTLDSCSQMTPIGAEGQVKQLGSRLLRSGRMKVSTVKRAKELFVAGVGLERRGSVAQDGAQSIHTGGRLRVRAEGFCHHARAQ
jgi:hypothetical protein